MVGELARAGYLGCVAGWVPAGLVAGGFEGGGASGFISAIHWRSIATAGSSTREVASGGI
jgi:hypothetical protein